MRRISMSRHIPNSLRLAPLSKTVQTQRQFLFQREQTFQPKFLALGFVQRSLGLYPTFMSGRRSLLTRNTNHTWKSGFLPVFELSENWPMTSKFKLSKGSSLLKEMEDIRLMGMIVYFLASPYWQKISRIIWTQQDTVWLCFFHRLGVLQIVICSRTA